ncbi:hypothetical protein GCM10017667_54890 [Streptomyces filamentosus]|uniref:Uncharacterized protein n=1 Tax=Streptomyces filamentosus TaxID=67294 RepID=A0A919ERQ5_STRFL|nr:hypothetical protein GCM10017667_54890 [Streptomyces filamentosus]
MGEGSVERVVMVFQIRSLAGMWCSLLPDAMADDCLVQRAGGVHVVLRVAAAGTPGRESRPPGGEGRLGEAGR